MAPNCSCTNVHPIMGYDIHFPSHKQPFPAQLAVMSKVLLGLSKSHHSLLESPTGSGKTLALLCSSLAWQKKEKLEMVNLLREELLKRENLVKKEEQLKREELRQNENVVNTQQAIDLSSLETKIKNEDIISQSFLSFPLKNEFCCSKNSDSLDIKLAKRKLPSTFLNDRKNSTDITSTNSDDDFESMDSNSCIGKRLAENYKLPSSFLSTKNNQKELPFSFSMSLQKETPSSTTRKDSSLSPLEIRKKRVLPQSFLLKEKENIIDLTDTREKTETKGKTDTKAVVLGKVSPIFFCSRTHSQLSQVVEELQSAISCLCNYDPKLAILGSRKHYCVHPELSNGLNKDNINDFCQEKLQSNNCNAFKRSSHLGNQLSSFYDIEDLLKLGKETDSCPYYYSRQALLSADLIICPYNYIIDPNIRKNMNIDLTNSIVILDEAHNIEDICRAGASCELSFDQIQQCNIELKSKCKDITKLMIKDKSLLEAYTQVLQVFQQLEKSLIQLKKDNIEMNGSQAIEFFIKNNILQPSYFNLIKQSFNLILAQEKENSSIFSSRFQNKSKIKKISNLSRRILDTIQFFFTTITYMLWNDKRYINDFHLVIKKENFYNRWKYKLCLWCLNPAILFNEITSVCRSVILTSGTLSPIDSFASELGTSFKITLKANHVINTQKQLFIASVSKDEINDQVDLTCQYSNQQNIYYQDALGSLILKYTCIIPAGILLFFPSYSLIEILTKRWQQTKLLEKIQEKKDIFIEFKYGGTEFDSLLDDYRRSVDENTKTNINTKKTGAIFMAVFRGKISEGIDFSDDHARAVLIIGIPYPNVKDQQVLLKKKYQDNQPKERNLLSGQIWYSHQAFRALNQALGRCIRHSKDYGAVLLLDPRFRQKQNYELLSKWAKQHIQHYSNTSDTIKPLEEFFLNNNSLEKI